MNSIQFLANTVDRHLHRDENTPSNDDSKSTSDNDPSSIQSADANEVSNEPETEPESLARSVPSNNGPRFVHTLLYVVFFLPNHLILKPMLFMWLVVIYPFTYFFNTDDSHNYQFSIDPNLSTASSDEKTELIKEESILSDTIKSPTSYSKFIISPPKNLFPYYKTTPRKKTLVLDLDETLIHSLSRGGRMSTAHMVEIKLNNIATLYFVHKRPFCDEFLKEVSKWYNLIIFTASVKEYADPVIDWLENGDKLFSQRLYRDDCTYIADKGYIKDLAIIDNDLSNLIIIDNSPVSYAFHLDNALSIEGWINDPSDNDLLHLIPVLDGLRFTTDVRSILSLKSGEESFDKYI